VDFWLLFFPLSFWRLDEWFPLIRETGVTLNFSRCGFFDSFRVYIFSTFSPHRTAIVTNIALIGCVSVQAREVDYQIMSIVVPNSTRMEFAAAGWPGPLASATENASNCHFRPPCRFLVF